MSNNELAKIEQIREQLLVQIQERMHDRVIARVAEQVGVTREWLSLVVNGKRQASSKSLQKIWDYLDK